MPVKPADNSCISDHISESPSPKADIESPNRYKKIKAPKLKSMNSVKKKNTLKGEKEHH